MCSVYSYEGKLYSQNHVGTKLDVDFCLFSVITVDCLRKVLQINVLRQVYLALGDY